LCVVVVLGRRFIESVRFPFREVSEASGVEKGPGRPPHWEMVFWWTRKPLISARAVIAGCLLPEDTNPANFLRSIGIVVKKRRADGRPVFEKSPHRVKPRLRFNGVRLLDPFAGFGSIPLEGLRLGLDVAAIELLPVAYLFLKAILEYPRKYGERIVRDVEKWGKWVMEQFRNDPIIREIYDEDTAAYLGSWEVKCPHCGRWTPLVGKWWLMRAKDNGSYKRLVWMEPFKEGDEIKIRVVDLNKMLGDKIVKSATVSGSKVFVGEREFSVPESNIEARREQAICLHCGQPMMQIDPETGKHYTQTKNLPENVKKRLEGYVKYALKSYNRTAYSEESSSLARPKLLVKMKIKQRKLEFEPCSHVDQEKLERARKEVAELLRQEDPDIPRESLAPYGTQAIGGYLQPINYNMLEWHMLFNPRQLLTLVKLVKLIRKASKLIEKQKLDEGLNKEEALKYAEAVTAYLAIALIRYVDYNSLCNVWNYGGHWGLHAQFAHTLSMRGIAMMWNWGDIFPLVEMGGTGTFKVSLRKVIKSLNYLVINKNHKRCKVLLDDATALVKLNQDEKFLLIITDPPYYADVPYAELSDFYYVWLKRALSDVEDCRLKPRFLPEAFFEKIGDSWVEVSTQWEKYALSEVSLNPPRLGSSATYEDGVKHFQNLLNSSFNTMASRLVDDGLLVTYYAHTDPDAWKALLEAGWLAPAKVDFMRR